MTRKVKSAKGVEVDFDLLKIKQQMADKPAPIEVKKREEFIDKKVRRHIKNKPVAPKVEGIEVDASPVENTTDDTEVKLIDENKTEE